MTISDDLRSGICTQCTDGTGRCVEALAAADRLDELEADNAASALLIADQAHRIGQLEAEVTSLNALLHRVVGRRP